MNQAEASPTERPSLFFPHVVSLKLNSEQEGTILNFKPHRIRLPQNLQSSLRLAARLLHASTSLILLALALAMLVLVLVLRHNRLDLRRASPQKNRVTPNVLALHIPRRLEEIISVAETHEAVALALGRACIPNHASLLHAAPPGEGFVQGLVGDFSREIADEEAEVRRVPFEQRGIGPGGATTGADDRLGIRLGVVDDGRDPRVVVCCRSHSRVTHARAPSSQRCRIRARGVAGRVAGIGTAHDAGIAAGRGRGRVFARVGGLPLRDLSRHLGILIKAGGGCASGRRARGSEGVANLGRRTIGCVQRGHRSVAIVGWLRLLSVCRLRIGVVGWCWRGDGSRREAGERSRWIAAAGDIEGGFGRRRAGWWSGGERRVWCGCGFRGETWRRGVGHDE